MKIGVLTSSKGWHFEDLARAAGKRHQLVQFSFNDISATIQDSGSDFFVGVHPLQSLDCVLVRAMSPGSLEQVVVRMDLLFQLEKIGVCVINPAKSIEAAVDKYLSLCRLQQLSTSIPRSGVFQSVEPALQFLERCNLDAVYKPLFGSEGRGLQRITDRQSALRLFEDLISAQQVIYLQQFVRNVAKDLRLFVVGDRVFGMSRHNELDWRKNISLGAEGNVHHVTESERRLAFDCAGALGTSIAGVDVLLDDRGKYQVVEVNSSPGWQTLCKTLNVDIAAEILLHLEKTVQREKGELADTNKEAHHSK